MGTSCFIRPESDFRRMSIGLGRPLNPSQAPCHSRGTLSRRTLPAAARSSGETMWPALTGAGAIAILLALFAVFMSELHVCDWVNVVDELIRTFGAR